MIKKILILLLIVSKTIVCSQNVNFTFVNTQNTNDGVNDYYEADIYISSDVDFKLGSGQIYFTYNTAAFGENIKANGNFEYLQPSGSILGEVYGFPAYKDFIVNDNTTDRVSASFQQGVSSGTITNNNVTTTPKHLFSIKIKYQDISEAPMIVFEEGGVYLDQFYTACGPASFGFPNCTEEPGVQLLGDTFDSSGASLVNEVVWTGINGRDWNEITNWTGNAVPLTTNNVIIPNVTTSPVIQTGESVQVNDITIETLASFDITGNGALTVDGSFTNNGTFAISSDATNSGTLIVKGTVNGNVTYERGGLLANKWSIITVPVSGQSIKEFIEAPENNIRVNNTVTPKRYAVAHYDDTKAEGTKWTYYTADDIQTNSLTFEQGKGYIISRATNGSVKFTGAIETADVNIAVQADQWNSVGNPYTAYMPINNNTGINFIQENLNKLNPANVGVYIWDTTQNKYVAKTLVGEATSLTVGQGFFVKTTAGVSSIAFKKSQRLSDATNVKVFSRKAVIPSIQILAKQGTITVDTNIKYITNATEGLDPGYDVGNFGGAEFDVFTRLVSETGTQNFTLQSLPNVNYEDMVIPLVIKSKVGKEISISMNIENLPTGIEVYLEDRLLGIETKLSDKDATYKITFKEKTDGTERFYIHTKSKALDVVEVNKDITNIYADTNKQVIIEGINEEDFTVTIFNAVGINVKEGTYKGTGKNQIKVSSLSTGTYLIKVRKGSKYTSKKVIIE